MPDRSNSANSGSLGHALTDEGPANGDPPDLQKWLAKNASASGSEDRMTLEKRKETSMRKPPRIRWTDDEDEFSGMPDVFLRQDTPALSSGGALAKKSILRALFLTVVIGGAVIYGQSGGDIGASATAYSRSLIEKLSSTFTGHASGDDTSGPEQHGEPVTSAELQTKARAALKQAIGTRQETTPPLPAAPPASGQEPEQVIETDAGQPPNPAAAEKAPPQDLLPSAPALEPERTASEHAAASLLPVASKSDAVHRRPKNTLSVSTPRLPKFVSIPGGTYEVPATQHSGAAITGTTKVDLRPFQIARTEVTRRDWLACADAAMCDRHGFPDGYFDEPGLDLPATSVTLPQIAAYLDWLNRWNDDPENPFRLPTEAEWIVAARGGRLQHSAFAWGNRFEAAKIEPRLDLIPVTDAPVFNGLSGILGNAEERVSDCWGAQLAAGGCFRNLGVVRGAPLGGLTQETAKLTYRSSRATTAPYSTVGFRLAR